MHDVGAGRPGAPRRLGERDLHLSSSSGSSPKRSSCTQSASPDTPTPSSRTPPVVSRSPSSARATRRDRGAVVGGAGQRAGAAQRGEVVQPHLDRHGAPGEAVLAHPGADLLGLAGQQALHQLAVGEVGVVGALDADRLRLALGDDGSGVLRAGELPQAVALGLAEQPDELVLADLLELGDGVDAGPPQPLGGRRADAGDDRDLHRPQQVELGARRHDRHPVGLVELAGDLGEELRRGDADGRGEPAGDLVHPARAARSPTSVTVATSRSGSPAAARSTKASSSESGSTSGREVAQHLHHLLARLAVGVEPAAQERRVRAAGPCLAARHRRADAERPGLVGRRGHDAAAAGAADDDRLAAQRRLVALLDGGEEGVQVEVEDRRGRTHLAILSARRSRAVAGHQASTGRTGTFVHRGRLDGGVRTSVAAGSVVVMDPTHRSPEPDHHWSPCDPAPGPHPRRPRRLRPPRPRLRARALGGDDQRRLAGRHARPRRPAPRPRRRRRRGRGAAAPGAQPTASARWWWSSTTTTRPSPTRPPGRCTRS